MFALNHLKLKPSSSLPVALPNWQCAQGTGANTHAVLHTGTAGLGSGVAAGQAWGVVHAPSLCPYMQPGQGSCLQRAPASQGPVVVWQSEVEGTQVTSAVFL